MYELIWDSPILVILSPTCLSRCICVAMKGESSAATVLDYYSILEKLLHLISSFKSSLMPHLCYAFIYLSLTVRLATLPAEAFPLDSQESYSGKSDLWRAGVCLRTLETVFHFS